MCLYVNAFIEEAVKDFSDGRYCVLLLQIFGRNEFQPPAIRIMWITAKAKLSKGKNAEKENSESCKDLIPRKIAASKMQEMEVVIALTLTSTAASLSSPSFLFRHFYFRYFFFRYF